MFPSTVNLLLDRMKTHDTLVCCGLDPDLQKIPSQIREPGLNDDEIVMSFLKSVIDITAGHVCAYKLQKAFFDLLPNGNTVLKTTIHYIHSHWEGIPVIVDGKIGDIDNTMKAYITYYFDILNADGIVVNPYMGDDVLLPLAAMSQKAIIVLAKTSNRGGAIVQDTLMMDGNPFWQHVLKQITSRWNTTGNMVPVISSLAELDMVTVRQVIPDTMPILFAGIGAQGGNLGNLHKLLNSEHVGVFVNSSRGILYSQTSNNETWLQAVQASVIRLKDELNLYRTKT